MPPSSARNAAMRAFAALDMRTDEHLTHGETIKYYIYIFELEVYSQVTSI